MNQKNFIELADAIREHQENYERWKEQPFDIGHVETLADFCQKHNPKFNRKLWLDYIAGKCGPRGGTLK